MNRDELLPALLMAIICIILLAHFQPEVISLRAKAEVTLNTPYARVGVQVELK